MSALENVNVCVDVSAFYEHQVQPECERDGDRDVYISLLCVDLCMCVCVCVSHTMEECRDLKQNAVTR